MRSGERGSARCIACSASGELTALETCRSSKQQRNEPTNYKQAANYNTCWSACKYGDQPPGLLALWSPVQSSFKIKFQAYTFTNARARKKNKTAQHAPGSLSLFGQEGAGILSGG